ncbi:MAG: diaminopimelate decarboxylase [Clostridiales bacterium]|uniref:diaminopimelate decarboxylase n=1 Tax=Provencibacterium massiliense TaxID=1841868 RepID=UPI0009A75342|nr:diaminopimelate decarboxylase [Provencibacterium massiliense]PWM39855.1 MAG: diaminopimelate decarboxylase [Clostridiales bacterium]RGB68356.1 diaminopimelate decarboxylase [Harryflintia acetispora]
MNESFSVNREGHLTIGGADTVALAKEYGTPLYVMDEGMIRDNCRRYRRAIDEFYGGRGIAAYASKAFSCKEIYRIVQQEGMGVDVVSEGELYTSLLAGFPADKIFFHGNNKSEGELQFAIRQRVGYIVVDNLRELHTLEHLLEREGQEMKILLRVKPGVDAHTHQFIRTGQIDSKFGFALETGEALAAARECAALRRARLVGLHCHIGSQIFEVEPFCLAARRLIGLMGQIRRECGLEMKLLNLGGGFGIKYTEEDDPVPYERFMERVSLAIHEGAAAEGLPVPYVVLEPGRSIVGRAGITLYTVGARKEIPGVRTYLSVDGGMTDNPRYALYQSKYEAIVANRAGEPKTETVTIAGRCCESGDLLAEGAKVQPCSPGDILAVLSTGAYNYSMASNYNRVPRPAVVMVKDGKSRVVVRRESLDDLVRNDL